jgi:hypothetical protein
MHMERVSTEKGIVLKRSLSGLEPGATADKMTGQQMVNVRHLRATARKRRFTPASLMSCPLLTLG